MTPSLSQDFDSEDFELAYSRQNSNLAVSSEMDNEEGIELRKWCHQFDIFLQELTSGGDEKKDQSTSTNYEILSEVFVYQDELVLLVSRNNLLNPIDSQVCLVSSDRKVQRPLQHKTDESNELKEIKESFEAMAGMAERILEEFDQEAVEYTSEWVDFSHKNQSFFYRLNRENYQLTKQANELLQTL